MIGTRLNHYEILGKLGEGGMGEVYKALDSRLNRHVVLKVLRRAAVEHKRRFLSEALIASALNHPNIITIYDLAVHEGLDYIVMEYVEGQTLDMILASGALPVGQAVDYAIQVASALTAAHQAAVVHRDLKPANIMVTPDGRVKLLDFGLAKLRGSKLNSTTKGSVVGTVYYMSPEQALGRPVDARSDVFGFGTLLYEMLTGRRAFGSHPHGAKFSSVLRETPVPPCELNPAVPPALSQITMRCLEKDPGARVQSATLLKQLLSEVTAGHAAALDQAVVAMRNWSSVSLDRAKEMIEQAVQRQPEASGVYSGIAEYYAIEGLLGIRPATDVLLRTQWAARKALERDSSSEQARVSLGIALACGHWKWLEAGAYLERTSTAECRLMKALWYLRPLGRISEAEELLRNVKDPRGRAALGWLSLESGDYEMALCHASAMPSLLSAWVTGWAHLACGRREDAIRCIEAAGVQEPGNRLIACLAAAASGADPGDQDLACAAAVWAARGDGPRALMAAHAAAEVRDPLLVNTFRLPVFGPWQSDPAYRAVLELMRMPAGAVAQAGA